MLALDGSNIKPNFAINGLNGGKKVERKPWLWSKDHKFSMSYNFLYVFFSQKYGTKVILGFHPHILEGFPSPMLHLLRMNHTCPKGLQSVGC